MALYARELVRPSFAARALPLILACLAMIGPFSIDAIFPAFPSIGKTFGRNAFSLQQLVSIFLLAYAVTSLFHGALSDAVGRKPVMLGALVIFTASSLVAAYAATFSVLLAARIFQGISCGAGIVVGRAIIRDSMDGNEAHRMMSRVAMVFGIAPALAPVAGSWILGLGSWRTLFFALSMVGLVLCVAIAVLIVESHPPERRLPFRLRPMAQSYMSIASDQAFWRVAMAGSANFAGLFLFISSAPYIIYDLFHLSKDGFTWLFIPTVIGMMSGSLMSGQLVGRKSPGQVISLGYRIMAGACVIGLLVNSCIRVPIVPWSTLAFAIYGCGVQITLPALTLLLLDRYPDRRGAASSMQSFLSLSLGAITSGVLAPLLSTSLLKITLGSSALCAAGYFSWTKVRDHRTVMRTTP